MTNTTRVIQLLASAVTILSLAVCGGSSTTASPTSPTSTTSSTTTTGATSATTSGSLPAIYSKFGNGTQVSQGGQTVVITTTDVPDHPSPYFGAGNANYEAPQAGMTLAPGR